MSQTKVEANEKPSIILRLFTNKKTRRITLAVLAGVILFSALGWYWYGNRLAIDKSAFSEANFSVYAPSKPPKGYKTVHDDTVLSNGVLTYSFQSQEAENTITVTVQAKPDNFDMAASASSGSINATATPNGTLYNLSTGQSSKYMLDAGDSLLFITSEKSISNAQINSLVTDLREAS